MSKNKYFFMYQPKFNKKGIFIRNLIFLILDILIINILYKFSYLNYALNYIYIRLYCIMGFYILRVLKYSFIFVKHRLDVLIVTTNIDLQDELYNESNLINDIIKNNFKELFLALEFLTLSIVLVYTSRIYMNIFNYFNFKYSIISHILFISLVVFISCRMEGKFKVSEDKHNILMFLVSGDKI
ncbi:hypothetical protein [Romboutsia sp. 1001713B170207_170306_H8]|uniref:hypothetical protein n=1 Tax=Romboutsia sp. 1001713B170207_170306_H8 TaxID=2787112 RepID=UPI0008212A75|nr:hypothetical protein [Romboutsia sp. 1001713B170207_170306_H8]SCH66723.1 Uncharacterised protein [uncultured Clostridium sp.]